MRVFAKGSLGVALAGVVLISAAAPMVAQIVLSGRRAPSFSLPDSKLAQHDILDYRGKWLLVEFMQTTCPHCRTLNIMLEDLRAKLPGKVETLAIVEPPDNTNTVGKYLADEQIQHSDCFRFVPGGDGLLQSHARQSFVRHAPLVRDRS